MTNRGFALFLLVACLFPAQVFAQTESTAAQLYGRGTYAFNAGQYADAIAAFNQMEQAATDDPRVFFFRGLSHLRSGNEAAATTDFQTASKMELTVSGRSYSVPKALERIQGRDRILIERYRRAAKKAWEADQNKRRQDEFQTQKEKNQQIYNHIIQSGEAAAATMPQTFDPDIKVPFGANPVMPFGPKELGVEQTNLVGVSDSGFTEDNIFKDDVAKKVEIEVPEEPAPKTPSRRQDSFENFDFGETTEVEGFDVGNLLEGSGSTSRLAPGDFLGDIIGGRDDDFDSPFDTTDTTDSGDNSDFPSNGDFGGPMNGGMEFDMPPGGMSDGGMTISITPSTGEPAKDAGRSFGGAFASLFKKSGTSKTPSQPAPATKPVDNSATDNGGSDEFDNIFDGGDDSSADDEVNPFDDESEADDEFSNPFDDF